MGTTIGSVPFVYRIALFLFLVAVALGHDFIKNGRSGARWKEAVFIITFGLLGAVYGLFHDLITSSISPEYFSMGKGLGAFPGLQRRAVLLGAQAGFAAGAITSCFCLYFNRPKVGVPVIQYSHLARVALIPLFCSMACAVLLGVAGQFTFPGPLLQFARHSLSETQFVGFRTVWTIHVGSYLGMVAGIVLGGVGIRKARLRVSETRAA